MEVEINKDTQFPLILVNGEVLVFDAKQLEYIGMFKNLYKDGFRTYHEHEDFSLSYSMWRIILSFLDEYDKSGELEPTKNSWTRVLASLDLPRLYQLVRIMDYYDVVVAMYASISIIVPRLMNMPRLVLREVHPLAIMSSETEMLSAMRNPFEIVNKQYSFRRQEILAVCVAYIKTYDIIQIIDRFFLPHVTSLACSNNAHNAALLTTSSGIKALGDNAYGQLGTGIENKDWTELDDNQEYEFPGETEEKEQKRLTQWKEWREIRLTKPEWLSVPMPAHLDIISIACGSEFTLFLTTDGLYGAGSATDGLLGSRGEEERKLVKLQYEGGQKVERYYLPTRLGITNVLLVACGWSHSMIYTTQGLFASGWNYNLQGGITPNKILTLFTRVPFFEDVAALALDGNVSFVLTITGKVYKAGALQENRVAPLHHLPTLTRIIAIVTSYRHALFLDIHGDVYRHDYVNSQNPRLDKGVVNFFQHDKIMGLPRIQSIFAPYGDVSFFVDTTGVLYGEGDTFISKYYGADPDDIIVIPVPYTVITIFYRDPDYYFVTCNGLYVCRSKNAKKGTLTFDKVDLQLSDVPLCAGGDRNAMMMMMKTLQEQNTLSIYSCHQCGEKDHTSLGYNKTMQRVFCHTKACLAEYKKF